jgi:2-polyprenyl-6-methoxyphenol hydroxylase-like FAD-dependent oxidoreductase
MNPSSVKTAKEDAENDVLCDTEPTAHVSTPLLIAADGTIRTIGNAIESLDQDRLAKMNPIQKLFAKPFRIKRYIDDNQRVYKTIPFQLPEGWRPDLNYSARTKAGINFDALPANANGSYCGVLILKKDDPMAQANVDPDEFRKRMDEVMPQFSALIDDDTLAQVAQKPVSYFPGFRYAGPRLHEGNCCILLGDCAHTVKPYFGLGANSALEDVKVLSECLNTHKDSTADAVRAFSRNRAPESKALVRLSRNLDRPGFLGVLTFLVPIILDGIFGRLAPGLFGPNIIRVLQLENYTFQKAARRKRFDRAMQLLIIGSVFSGMASMANILVRSLARLIGKSTGVVWSALLASIFAFSMLSKNVPSTEQSKAN